MSIDDLLKSQKILRELLESPSSQLNRALESERQLLRAFEQTDAVRHALDDANSLLRHDPLSQLRRSLAPSSAEQALRSPTITAFNDVRDRLGQMQASWQTTAGLLRELARPNQSVHQAQSNLAAAQEALQAPSWWNALQTLKYQPLASLGREVYQDLLFSLEGQAAAKASFAGEVVTRLDAIERAEPEKVGGKISELTEWFTAEVARQPKKTVNYMALLSVMLAIVIFIYQEVSSARSEARLGRQIAESEQRMLTAIQAARPEVPASLLVTTKSVHLRRGPAKTFESIRLLPINTLLEQRDGREGDWVEVDHFDLRTSNIETGWVYRPFLKIVRQ